MTRLRHVLLRVERDIKLHTRLLNGELRVYWNLRRLAVNTTVETHGDRRRCRTTAIRHQASPVNARWL